MQLILYKNLDSWHPNTMFRGAICPFKAKPKQAASAAKFLILNTLNSNICCSAAYGYMACGISVDVNSLALVEGHL